MDKSLARGYARMYLRSLPDRVAVAEEILEKRGNAIFDVMEEIASKKRPDRAMRRLAGLLPAECEKPDLLFSSRQSSFVSSTVIAQTPRNAIYTPRAGTAAFEEATAEMARVFLTAEGDDLEARFMASAKVSRHAIERLMQRGAIPGTNLARDLRKVLFLTDHVLWRLMDTTEKKTYRDNAFLIPFRGGALVASFVAQASGGKEAGAQALGWAMSVRTYLAPSMLGEEERDRLQLITRELTGLKMSHLRGPAYMDCTREIEETNEIWCRVFEQNAQPWEANERRGHAQPARSRAAEACVA